MFTSTLLLLDLGAAVIAAGSWVAVTSLVGSPMSATRAGSALALILLGLGALASEVALSVALAGRGWWFVQEKAHFALPLAGLATAVALALVTGPLWRTARGRPASLASSSYASLVAAAAAGVVGIIARAVVGYPLDLAAGAVLLALVVLAAWLAYAVASRQGRRLITGIAALCVLAIAAPLGLAWFSNVATPGALDAAHAHAPAPDAPGPAAAAAAGARPASTLESPGTSVSSLRTPADPLAARTFEITASEKQVTLASGAKVSAWTYGSLPGPTLRVTRGELVEVTLRNADVKEGVTLHWHGYDVLNGEDGVAGVTQDAVRPGGSFTYRFRAGQAGTYWYHTHQASSEGVERGLYGSLVVLPPAGIDEERDFTLPLHSFGRSVLLGASDQAEVARVPIGTTVRLRLINTDQLPTRFRVTGERFRVVAIDGQDVAAPDNVENVALRVPAGGRVDVALTMPPSGVLLTTSASKRTSLTLSVDGKPIDLAADPRTPDLDMLYYGAGKPATPLAGDRLVEAEMVLDRLPRFVHGVPSEAYTVGGAVFPHIPSIEVTAGNVVRLTVANRGWETHPMHVHGHHVLVKSVNGAPSTGSPLWLDTFDVQPGEVWVVEFEADNPGIWMDHCHNLDHASAGMMMALRYSGVVSPFEEGGVHGNRSE